MEKKKLSNEELNRLQQETYEHLWNGRFRMALTSAKTLYLARPDESETAICLAWAYLENNNPTKAMEYANLAVELKGDQIKARLYRGFILMRMSIFEGSIQDFNKSVDKQKESLAWTYLNKARALAGLNKYPEALKSYELALIIDGGKTPEWKESKVFYDIATIALQPDYNLKLKDAEGLIKRCETALKLKEYWFVLHSARKILQKDDFRNLHEDAALLELDSMINLFQYRPALKKVEELRKKFRKNPKINELYKVLQKLIKQDSEEDIFDNEIFEKEDPRIKNTKSPSISGKNNNLRYDTIIYPNDDADFISVKMFDVKEDSERGIKRYYRMFDIKYAKQIGAEIIFNNPFYKISEREYRCEAVWYVNDFVVGRNNFQLKVNKDWDAVVFAQTWGSDENDFWKEGQAKFEIYINNLKALERFFVFGNKDMLEPEKEKSSKQKETNKEKTELPEVREEQPVIENPEQTLEELLEELDEYIGLNKIKSSVRDFVSYLEYLEKRKTEGLKSDESVSLNCVFVGNPGTGKTTIARLFGKIFRAMGILERGHVIEVDRSALVGQYIGETAQKTEKIIEDAKGGVLFIDEAYTLVKKGGTGQDFGQEAIDVLLKRMEDRRGEFLVIVAGYTEEMETFINSNPGLKSRFNRTFIFEDYSPDELLSIFRKLCESDEYILNKDAESVLKKEFMNLYRKRDKTFGNARLVRQFFEESKLNLGKRFLGLPEEERTRESMMKIESADIESILDKAGEKNILIPIDEEKLTEALMELNSLIGLESVKKDVRDLVKLVRYYIEQGEDVKTKYSSHILFLGNPGTGKTTVARILSKIYSAVGLLPKGHLIEVDRQALVAGFVGQTAEKTTQIINQSIGGTLFIDEAYTLFKKDNSGSDFGKEAIDTLLKRMEDDRGKFIVIAAGYTDEMKTFVESNPGIQSRFTKSFTFEDYTPNEMLEITRRTLKDRKIESDENVEKELLKHYSDIYRIRDKSFGNARIVRNLIDAAQHQMMLRIAGMTKEQRDSLPSQKIEPIDLRNIIQPTTEAKHYELNINDEQLNISLEELNNLIDRDQVKDEIKKLINGIKVSRLRKERGMKVVTKNLHSVFLGNTGTGKTTIARLMSKILKELGILEKGHLTEVDRADLVVGYQGQTTIKTNEIIKKSLGGVLLINDAYSLSRGGNDFGQEVIDTLIKKMDDYQDKFVVIISGYSDEMKLFLDANPVMESRFVNRFFFDDYEPRQLLEIADNIARTNGYKLDEGALQLLLEYFNKLYQERDKYFGNAVTAKNVLYKAISFQEERIAGLYDYTDEDLMTIIHEDVEKIIKS